MDGALLVAEYGNTRATRWAPGATEGVVVAGGNGPGAGLQQLDRPWGLAVDMFEGEPKAAAELAEHIAHEAGDRILNFLD